MNFNTIKIETQTLGTNPFPTFFVELLTIDDKGTTAETLLKTEDKDEARTFARTYADLHVLRVEDETLVQEMVAAYKARGYVADAKYKAMATASLERSIMRAHGGRIGG